MGTAVWLASLAIAIVTFLLGSFPTGYLLVRVRTGKDIRRMGSGNIGATNVSRVLGKKWAVFAFMIDALKGYIPLFILSRYPDVAPWQLSLWAFAAVAGHCFCPWLKWNGGKGVAVAEGVMLAIMPQAALIGILTYLVTAFVVKISAVGSLAGLAATLLFVSSTDRSVLPVVIAIGALLVFRHKSNIKQLLAKRRRA